MADDTTDAKNDPAPDKAKNPKAPPQTRDGAVDAAADPDAPQPNTTGDIPMKSDTHLTDSTTIEDPNTGLDAQEDKAEQSAYERAHPASLGLLTEPEHALPVLRAKVGELHKLMANVGNVADIPIQAIESLGADIGYLLRLFRHAPTPQAPVAAKPAPIVTQQPAKD